MGNTSVGGGRAGGAAGSGIGRSGGATTVGGGSRGGDADMTASGRRRKVKPRPPADPTSLTVTLSGTTATLLWADNSRDEAAFEVERRAGGESLFTLIAVLSPNIVTYTDSGLLESTTYQYRVRAINDEGTSTYTNTVSVTTASTAPPPPAPATPPTAVLSLTTPIVTRGTPTVVSTVGTIPGSVALATWALAWGDGVVDRGDGVPTGTQSHTYAAVGAYTITLTVTDTSGLTDDAQVTPSVIAAPPLPVPSTTIASPVFTSTGWATFGLVAEQGKVPAGSGVQVGALTTQTNVKTTWGDGSAKHLIATAKITSTGTHTITAIADPGGSLTPTWPSASVAFNISGTTYTATLPAFDGTDTWCNGALMREARTRVTPTTGGGSEHALLQVIFDVRMYHDGAYRVDVTAQNVKDVAAGNSVTYDVTVLVGGSTVYTKTGVTHFFLTRWRKTFVSAAEAEMTQDVTPFVAAGLVPEFATTVTNQVYASVTGSRYDILTWGDMTPYMPAPGGRPDIGFLPYWTAQYLVHRTPSQRAYMLKAADLSGSWSGHITESNGSTLISLATYPNYWLDSRSLGNPNGPRSLTGTAVDPGGGGSAMLENAHMPSLTYVPYLITGDRYYLDQTKFWANFAMLSTWPGEALRPRGTNGILSQNQVRGLAWGLRALAECVTACPDSDSDRSYFSTRLQANLDYLDTYSRDNSAWFGALEIVSIAITAPVVGWADGAEFAYIPWQMAYLTWALENCRLMGFSPTTHLRDRILRFQVRLVTSDPDYPREYGAPYFIAGGTLSSPGGVFSAWVPYTSMATIFSRTYGGPPPIHPPQPLAGYYGPETRAMLILAEQQGIAGASTARAWLELQTGVLADVNLRSGFAIAA